MHNTLWAVNFHEIVLFVSVFFCKHGWTFDKTTTNWHETNAGSNGKSFCKHGWTFDKTTTNWQDETKAGSNGKKKLRSCLEKMFLQTLQILCWKSLGFFVASRSARIFCQSLQRVSNTANWTSIWLGLVGEQWHQSILIFREGVHVFFEKVFSKLQKGFVSCHKHGTRNKMRNQILQKAKQKCRLPKQWFCTSNFKAPYNRTLQAMLLPHELSGAIYHQHPQPPASSSVAPD